VKKCKVVAEDVVRVELVEEIAGVQENREEVQKNALLENGSDTLKDLPKIIKCHSKML
jgi:hypothetical protein